MLAGDVINDWRRLVNEPNTNRFTVQDSLDFFSKAQRELMFEIDFPEATYNITWAAGVKEYAMLENYKILRVYVVTPGGNKQIAYGSNIGILEGDITESYDNTSGQLLGNPVQTPNWIAGPSVNYPVVTGQQGGVRNTTGAFKYNQDPVYYMRGGNIGVLPIPTTGVTICVDYLPIPPTITNLSDVSVFPVNMQDVLAYKMASYSRMADNSSQAVTYTQLYEKEVKEKIRPMLDARQASMPKKFIPTTMRNRLRGRYKRYW